MMSTKLKMAGTAAALAAALGEFVLISAGESASVAAAPAALAPAPSASLDAKPAPAHQAAAADCGKQAWPYVAPECLAAARGTPVRKAIRAIEVSAR
ncbi:hypothetical protein [Enterovirga sp. CN4-39]|uniref:hypothetical protein n=1 Tax=Enterovirga sp. CN4-39 TaxID=3400910 RepID=UPI003C027566